MFAKRIRLNDAKRRSGGCRVKVVKGLTIALCLAGTGLFAGVVATGAPASAASSGKSYSVMVLGAFTGPESFTTPEIVAAVEGALRDVHGVKVIPCDTQSSADGDLDCEHQAVVDGVAAVIGGGGDQAILLSAGIPLIGSSDTTSSNSFAVDGSLGVYTGIGVGLAKTGCHRLGILYYDGTQVLANAIVAGGKWQSVTDAVIPFNAPDLAPDIAKLAGARVQCIALSVEPSAVPQAMTAIKQNDLKVTLAASSAIFTPQVIKALGSQANGVILVDSWVDPLGGGPVIAQIRKDMKAVNPKEPVTEEAVINWASAKLMIDAVNHIHGSVTAASMMKALNGLRNASTDGAIPPFSSVELPNPAYKRFFNHYGIDYVIKNGKAKALTKFFNLEPFLATSTGAAP